ncbi:mitochondrial import inner membrane translocase subunit Tim10 B-like isoform X2 [Antedon mediterranea]|uniref:mitochondrial import inner membrane translocase subunit Tim10 B-like isoform X2 n=1 Tax=Antedon mediterranea TaxID=105859 RepID=UPI003AF90B25
MNNLIYKMILRDYLAMYNIFTQKCFNSCVTNLNYRFMTQEEHTCVQKCAQKLININHRLITVYMEINPMNKYREQQEQAVKEMEAKQLEEAQNQASLPTEPQATSADQAQQGGLAKQISDTFEGVQITDSNAGNNNQSSNNVNNDVNSTIEVR